jgi:hypothetical protein
MIWFRYAIALAAILITGRIHGKRSDEVVAGDTDDAH